jgi:hypothetical protein
MLPRSLETMSSYAEKRFLPYTPALLFEVVAAVDRYPEFLPWCLAVRIRSSEKLQGTPDKALIVDDLVIGSRMIRERYRSRVTAAPTHRRYLCRRPVPVSQQPLVFEPVTPSPQASRRRHDADVPYQVRIPLEAAGVAGGRVVRRGQQAAWWPRSNAAPCGFTASADRGRSGLEVTPNPTQGEMLVDALF